MSWADDFLKQQQGAEQAQRAAGSLPQSFTGGFVSSTFSAIPELFGEKPTESAEVFRAEHPVWGIGSQLLGGILPYAGAGLLSETATGARLLGQAMKATPGVRTLTAVDNPILYSAAKEAIRYSPVELARLGVGLGTTDNWHDYGNLLADVGLSTLITGGFGGIGGFFRVGGETLPKIGGVGGAPIGLRPTFEFRMSQSPDAVPALKNSSMGDVQNDLMKQVFTEVPHKTNIPGQSESYIQGLDGGNPETTALMNSLFKPAVGEKASVKRVPLMDKAGNWSLNEGQMKELLGGLEQASGGLIKSTQDIAANMVFPRLVTAQSARAAGTISKALDDSAMQWVADGVMAGKESSGGLHVMAVRLKAGEAPTAARMGKLTSIGNDANYSYLTYQTGENSIDLRLINQADGTAQLDIDPNLITKNKIGPAAVRDAARQIKEMFPDIKAVYGDRFGKGRSQKIDLGAVSTAPPKIAAGDQWMLFKTDQPHVFAPEGYKLAKSNVEAWAKFRNAWRPSGMDDFANADMDNMIHSFTVEDYMDRVRLPEPKARAQIAERLAGRFAETAGLKDSATIKSMVDNFFDVMAPTVLNERRNPLFARLLGTLRSATNAGEARVNKAVGGNVRVTGSMWTRRNLEHGEGIVPGQENYASAISRLSSEELQDYVSIATAQAPMDELEKYTANGLVSDNLRKAVEVSQTSDRFMWENDLMPAFQNSNLAGKFDLLEGYIMPRMWTGDWFVPVNDEFGRLQWLANGSRSQGVHEAKQIVAEAEKQGRKLTIGDPYMVGAGKAPDQISDLHSMVQMQIGKDAQMKEIVQAAMKKMAIDMAQKRQPSGRMRTTTLPKTLTEERGGIAGSPDTKIYTHQEVIKAIDSHYKQLYRFAAVSAWERRFGGHEAVLMSKDNPTLYEDLKRKKNQIMGYEGQITNALNKALNPILGTIMGGKPATKIAVQTNELLYNWNLALMNPTFSVLNVLQPIQTVLPHLSFILSAMKRGLPEIAERDMHMTLRMGADGKPREVIGVLSAPKILGRAVRLMSTPDEELKGYLGRAKTEGHLMAQLYENFIGGQSRGLETIRDSFKNAGGGAAGSWEAMKRIATFTAERSEEVSRAIAFNSYYILGKDYLGLEGDKLYRFMVRGTRNSMFGYGLIDRSRMFTGPVGSMFGLFKNWQMHFIASMFQYAKLGWQHGAWGPMLWQFGVAGALGGVGAMGPLKWIADGLAGWHDNSPNSYLWMQDHWHEAADELYFGLPALFGASLQASSTIPGTDVRNDLTTLSNFVFLERAKAAGKAVGAAWDYGVTNGEDPLRNPNIRDQLMQAFAPRAFFRAFASAEGDYIKSMSTGYPQVRDVSPLSKFLYGAGLNQVEVERQQVAARELWKNQEAQRKLISQLGIALADAQLNGDWDEMEAINRRGMAAGVPMTSVYNSARTRLRREQQQDILSQYKGELAQRYRQSWLGE